MFTIHGSMTTRYPFLFIFDSEHELEGDFNNEHPQEIVFDIEQNSFFKIVLTLDGITGNKDYIYRKLSIPSRQILIQAGWEFDPDDEQFYAKIPCSESVEVEYLVEYLAEYKNGMFIVYININTGLEGFDV